MFLATIRCKPAAISSSLNSDSCGPAIDILPRLYRLGSNKVRNLKVKDHKTQSYHKARGHKVREHGLTELRIITLGIAKLGITKELES